MITQELARRFIERVTKYTQYNVNIMDENGIIIASRDPERVGQYHVVAHQVLVSGLEIQETRTDAAHNVRRGINMVIEVDGRREGVVGVTGDPGEIRAAALMTKMAIETMLRYEREQEERRKRENRKERFFYLITQAADAREEELLSLARELGYSEDPIRVPVLLRVPEGSAQDVLEMARKAAGHGGGDISAVLDPGHVMVLKSVPDSAEELMAAARTCLTEYVEQILMLAEGEKPSSKALSIQAYAGSFQKKFVHYHDAFRHCRWLERHAPSGASVIFFYDQINAYVAHLAPMQELNAIFRVYEKQISAKLRPLLVETILTLAGCNFNFPQAAKELFVHKNTLAYRYRQIKEATGLDPMASSSDRILLVSLCTYLKKIG